MTGHLNRPIGAMLRLGAALAMLAAALAVAMPAAPSAAGETTMVVVLPASGNHEVGDLLLVEVHVQNVTNLYGADIKLNFDPGRLQAVSTQVTPRSDLLSPDLVLIKSANNNTGEIQYVVSQVGADPVSGSGALFSFQVRFVGPGVASIAIEQQTLASLDGQIPAGIGDANYAVTGTGYLYLPLIARSP